jgi:two-component system sensor histidine kinase DesK
VDDRGLRARRACHALGAALLIGRLGWRRWSELTRVERVGLYTRQSLYLVLWSYNGSILLGAAANKETTTPPAEVLGCGLAVTALAAYAFAWQLKRFPALDALPWRRVVPLLVASAALLALSLATWTGPARGAAAMTVATSLIAVFALLPGRGVVIALVLGCGLLLGVAGGEPVNYVAGAVVGALFVFAIRASVWLLQIVQELDDASHAKAQLAVVEERLRFSRDVHDVLGRRLSTIAVQAELAAALAARGDDERAAERMLEVRGVAHEALREARELARGYRATNFLQELEGARSLLRSAGIEVRLDVEAMPRAWQEAAGWIVRESVTNVLRHSSASVVEIDYTGERLRVINDGARPREGRGSSSDGSGLRSLGERLAPLGASLDAGADADGGWQVVAELPGTGPLNATRTEGRTP